MQNLGKDQSLAALAAVAALINDTSSRIVFVRFLGELKTPKGHFEINWPLEEDKKDPYFLDDIKPKRPLWYIK